MVSYEDRLYSFLMVLLGDRDLACDCVQDTFLRAYENLARGKSVNIQWLYKVARNRAMDHFRRRQRFGTSPLYDSIVMVDEAMADDMEERDIKGAVHRALSQLSPADREILYLAHRDGFKRLEIAQMLGIRAGTVRMRLLRAHGRFRAVYENES